MSLQSPPHARGVFREPFTINGTFVFNVYRCDGELMEMALVHPEWNPDQQEQELIASLDLGCPIHDPIAHRAVCLAARSRLRVV